jgi:hypothetical protein
MLSLGCLRFNPTSLDDNNVMIREENAICADARSRSVPKGRLANASPTQQRNALAALEVMSRFTANPKWLIYLPPTMSPCETSGLVGIASRTLASFLKDNSNAHPTRAAIALADWMVTELPQMER